MNAVCHRDTEAQSRLKSIAFFSAPRRLCDKPSASGALGRDLNQNLQRIGPGAGRERDGGGGFCQREAVGDEPADVEPAGEDEPCDFGLQGEVGGVAADEVLLVHADGRQIEAEGGRELN